MKSTCLSQNAAGRWVVDALKDWAARHRGGAAAEVGYRRCTNFARYMLRQGFDNTAPGEPTDASMDVDAAVAFLRARNAQGAFEAEVLEAIYLYGARQRDLAETHHTTETRIRNAKLVGETAVETYLVLRCGRGAKDWQI